MSEASWILGIDFNDTDTQISWVQKGKEEEPITLELNLGEERYQFPTMLCKKNGADVWVFGQEAKRRKVLGEGITAEHLLEHCYREEKLTAEDKEYEPLWLLAEYFRQLFFMLKKRLPKGIINRVVFTVPGADKKTEELIRAAMQQADIQVGDITVTDYEESFAAYVMRQPKELRLHGSLLFSFRNKKFQGMELVSEKKGNKEYLTVKIYESEAIAERESFYAEKEESYEQYLDQQLQNFAAKCIGKKLLTSVYLVGDIFDGEWMKDSLTTICKGRRVFLGKNLYTKGACFNGMEKVGADTDWIFAGADTVLDSIGIRMRIKGREEWYALTVPGQKWYEKERCFEMILDQENWLEFVIVNRQGEQREEKVFLDGLPSHRSGTLRVQVRMQLSSVKECHIVIKDVGFGMIRPATDYQKEIELKL